MESLYPKKSIRRWAPSVPSINFWVSSLQSYILSPDNDLKDLKWYQEWKCKSGELIRLVRQFREQEAIINFAALQVFHTVFRFFWGKLESASFLSEPTACGSPEKVLHCFSFGICVGRVITLSFNTARVKGASVSQLFVYDGHSTKMSFGFLSLCARGIEILNQWNNKDGICL